MNTTIFSQHSRGLRAAGLIIAASAPPLWAQEQDCRRHRERDESGLETIVVTGVASSDGVKKLEASYNIVTANEEADPPVESQEHGGSAEDLARHVAGIDRRSDRRQHRNRRISRRRRRAVLHDAADGFAVVRHADAVVLRNHEHLPSRRHGRDRWKSCRADRRWCSPAARWAPPSNFLLKTGTETPKAASA